MSLKKALFEMKESIQSQNIAQSKEDILIELENKYEVPTETLRFYYDHFVFLQTLMENQAEAQEHSKKMNRKWTENEIELMFRYIPERQAEGALNITEILEEVAYLFNRGYQSVNYKYYTLLKNKEKDSFEKPVFSTISEVDVPVLSVAELSTVPSNTNNVDFLEIISGLISNVEQLPGINLVDLLGSLYQLTTLALQNQQVTKQIEHVKETSKQEQETLRQTLLQKERLLVEEKKRNDQLQKEVAKLAKEIAAFNKLGDTAKIKNLKSYNQRLSYLIDTFDQDMQMGS
ncbi:hypothetical protein PU629_13845 [Pullulanibacillus sp. KACC 23026]|uniref:hypothetical protein n=1 Tax=Pullulanibacillus sp. KACC 23026 TaxID=3028315 RepID=UPI0023AFA2CC|nr:hypothetical protein [Pullulanibacillus sp. KACC 23026]WEG11244.1 hypothetical protein PU629_13845 [Pullulanibacillus sp. KACC 23026]